MERKIESFFKKWQKDIIRKPLILYGPKQVGKTFSALSYGSKEYKNVIYFMLILINIVRVKFIFLIFLVVIEL